jgi:hypothetical protein
MHVDDLVSIYISLKWRVYYQQQSIVRDYVILMDTSHVNASCSDVNKTRINALLNITMTSMTVANYQSHCKITLLYCYIEKYTIVFSP